MDLKEAKQTGVLRLDRDDLNDPGTMQVVQNLLDQAHDAYHQAAEQLAAELSVSEQYANCILYLRTRSRWTQENEDRLIEMARNDEPTPNMNEWPPDYFED